MLESPRDRFDSDSDGIDPLRVVVIDSQHTRWADDIDDWNAATLLACLSEDPADWEELADVWPRYRDGPAAEFPHSLPLEITDFERAVEDLSPRECWLVLDLQQHRVFSSPCYGDVRRDGCFGWNLDEEDAVAGSEADAAPPAGPPPGPKVRMWIHLPPWWEVHNNARPQQVAENRMTRVGRPRPRRDVLWGKPLAAGLAERLLDHVRRPTWTVSGARSDRETRYRLTVEVHRDWLMRPREDLDGRTPRDGLHGGIDWIASVVEGQQWNIAQGRTPIGIPRDLSSYAEAPMGRAEVCLYFDLCREMIEFGWQWLLDHEQEIGGTGDRTTVNRLSEVLEAFKQEWLHAPFEGGPSPSTVIRNERDRIPQIETFEDGHVLDCDCPICRMMAEGLFGPTFICFDGHHLELDDEFAFSLSETREEWESTRAEFAEMASEISGTLPEKAEADEFDSPWPNSLGTGNLPGDPLGHLGLSFRMADIVGELQMRDAPQFDLDTLNGAFDDYRHASQGQRRCATRRLKEVLEQLAIQYPTLISRAADLQSQLDERLRGPTPADTGRL